MNRRKFFCALTIAVAVSPTAAGAQRARETARVGFLSPGDRQARGWQARVLTEALRGHGWVEGKNLAIEYRFGGEQYERLRALAEELGLAISPSNSQPSLIWSST
jgi:putative tryptophan/tyrosine transport system substrate-binding protein